MQPNEIQIAIEIAPRHFKFIYVTIDMVHPHPQTVYVKI